MSETSPPGLPRAHARAFLFYRRASSCRISRESPRSWTWLLCAPQLHVWAVTRKQINPLVPVDLVIDHSIQVDFFATSDALTRNTEMEFQRNRERYEFLKWGQKAFSNFRVVPPMTGIVHQVNLEYLADVVMTKQDGG
jgi:hypothetical protein